MFLIRDQDDLRRYLDAARNAATKRDRPAEQLTETERAAQVLAILHESGALPR
jgi:hypothetical protein